MRVIHGDKTYGEFFGSESTAQSRAHVVFDGFTLDDGAQFLHRTGSLSASFSSPQFGATLLLSGLIEVALDPSLIVLVHVDVGPHIVMLDHG